MQNKLKPTTDKLTWPTISRKTNLHSLDILPKKQLFIVHNFFTLLECKNVIKFAESQLTFVPTEKGPPKRGYAFRDNDRILVTNQHFADALWKSGVYDLFQNTEAVGLNPNIRLYKYAPGQQFGPHIDESVKVDSHISQYTVLVYLSGGNDDSGLKGGELIFYKGKNKVAASIQPVAGLLVIHEHGDKCLEHEAAKVVRGCKYVLRTDVMFK
jgi:hypothetical protein